MKRVPVAVITMPPIELPVFDAGWKAKCRTCAALRRVDSASMRCAKTPVTFQHSAKGRNAAAGAAGAYCLDSRQVGGLCGPEASMWEAA